MWLGHVRLQMERKKVFNLAQNLGPTQDTNKRGNSKNLSTKPLTKMVCQCYYIKRGKMGIILLFDFKTNNDFNKYC